MELVEDEGPTMAEGLPQLQRQMPPRQSTKKRCSGEPQQQHDGLCCDARAAAWWLTRCSCCCCSNNNNHKSSTMTMMIIIICCCFKTFQLSRAYSYQRQQKSNVFYVSYRTIKSSISYLPRSKISCHRYLMRGSV